MTVSAIWNGLLDLFRGALEGIHDGIDGVFGAHAWGWAIILLTLAVRVLLLPLAAKQFRSMRAMQALQPEIKRIQRKYKVDRELARKDPERYRQRRQKMNEELMALYKERGVNPAAGCLPLLLQAPIFFALFRVLQSEEALKDAPFYFLTSAIRPDASARGLGATASQAGWPGWLLVLLIVASMFWTMRQTQARRDGDELATQQQRIMMYVMPVFLGVVSINFPLGVLLYWVTTNLWQLVQQAIILREVRVGEAATAPAPRRQPPPPTPAPPPRQQPRRSHLPEGRRRKRR